ncbi:MAG: hypothetical protein IPM79_02520 [Polyangiaceae bacterium]|nr:hypothetical protein [Polyangiaceae bacterium]
MARRNLPPRGLRASVLEVGGESVVVLSHPIDEPELQGLTEAESDVRRRLVQGSSYAQIAKLRGRASPPSASRCTPSTPSSGSPAAAS